MQYVMKNERIQNSKNYYSYSGWNFPNSGIFEVFVGIFAGILTLSK